VVTVGALRHRDFHGQRQHHSRVIVLVFFCVPGFAAVGHSIIAEIARFSRANPDYSHWSERWQRD
jgi:hypothetical protein